MQFELRGQRLAERRDAQAVLGNHACVVVPDRTGRYATDQDIWVRPDRQPGAATAVCLVAHDIAPLVGVDKAALVTCTEQMADLMHELERAQQEPRGLLAPGLPHSGQTKVGQLHDAEAMAPTDAAATPTAPTSMAEPGDADGPRDPALASEKGGSVLVRQGNLPTTLDKYLDALTIAERLAEADPENADWQRDLAVSHEKIGDALLTQGNLLAALANFRASLAIVDRLAKTDPESADRQTELAMSHEKIGDVLAGRGHLLAALDNFRAAHAIADRSAETDPRNASWQLDLAMSHDKIGDVLAQQNELAVALKSFSCVCANWLPATRRFRKTWPGSRSAWQS